MGHPQHREGAIVYIVGAPGAGKTTHAVDVIRQLRKDGRRILGYDLTGDIRAYLARSHVRARVIHNSRELQSTTDKLNRLRGVEPRLVLWDGTPRELDADSLARNWLEYANLHTTRDDVLVADEAEHAFPIHSTDRNALRLLDTGRNDGRLLIVATKRPQRTHNTLRGNTRFLCVFGLSSEAVIKNGLAEFGRDYKLWLPALELPKFHYLYMDLHDRTQRVPMVVNDAEEYAPWLDAARIR